MHPCLEILFVFGVQLRGHRLTPDLSTVPPGKSSSIDRKAQLPRRNSERYSIIDEQFCNISAFKPATITISTIFKQVRLTFMQCMTQ